MGYFHRFNRCYTYIIAVTYTIRVQGYGYNLGACCKSSRVITSLKWQTIFRGTTLPSLINSLQRDFNVLFIIFQVTCGKNIQQTSNLRIKRHGHKHKYTTVGVTDAVVEIVIWIWLLAIHFIITRVYVKCSILCYILKYN